MGGPSEKALAHVQAEWSAGRFDYDDWDGVLAAAHDTALGLDRSVCLRDVVNALRNEDPAALKGFWPALHFIEDEFG